MNVNNYLQWWTGIYFYVVPEWSKLSETQVWRDAAIQVFYSFGIAGGGMLTYASYNKFNEPIVNDWFCRMKSLQNFCRSCTTVSLLDSETCSHRSLPVSSSSRCSASWRTISINPSRKSCPVDSVNHLLRIQSLVLNVFVFRTGFHCDSGRTFPDAGFCSLECSVLFYALLVGNRFAVRNDRDSDNLHLRHFRKDHCYQNLRII